LKINGLEGISNAISKYIEARVDLAKLDILEKITAIIVVTIQFIIALTLISVFIFFLNLAIAALLNYWLKSSYLGYLIVALIQILILLIVILNRKAMSAQFEKRFITSAFKKIEDYDKEKNG